MSDSMSWLDKIAGSKLLSSGARKRNVPEGLWTKCESCQSVLYRAELERARLRIATVDDERSVAKF